MTHPNTNPNTFTTMVTNTKFQIQLGSSSYLMGQQWTMVYYLLSSLQMLLQFELFPLLGPPKPISLTLRVKQMGGGSINTQIMK